VMRNDDLADRMTKVICVGDAIRFGFVPPNDDRAAFMVGDGVGDVLADVDLVAIHGYHRGSVYKTVNERRVRILKNLLGSATELVGLRVQL